MNGFTVTTEGSFTTDPAGPVGHFVTDEAPEAVTRLLLSHLEAQR